MKRIAGALVALALGAAAHGCHLVAGFDDVAFVSDGGAGGGGGAGGAGDGFVFRVNVSDLISSGLRLRLEAGDASEEKVVDEDGEVAFDTPLPAGEAYALDAVSPIGESCTPASSEGTVEGDVTVDVTCVPVVAPLFADAPQWNDYASTADGQACLPAAATRFDDCVHGGERRFVWVPGADGCEELSAVDALGVFEWTCDPSTSPVRMVSTGFVGGAGLRSLIDTDGLAWTPNHVSVEDGSGARVETEPAVWWTNEIREVAELLDAPSTVYVALADVGSTIDIAAPKVALVVADGVSLSAPGAPAVAADGQDHLWLEGQLDAGGEVGVSWMGVRMSTIHRLVVDGGSDGVVLSGSPYNRLIGIESHASAGTGVTLSAASDGSLLKGARVGACGGDGVLVEASADNRLVDVVVADCDRGVVLEAADASALGAIRVANHAAEGVLVSDGSDDCIMADVMAISNGAHGVRIASDGAIAFDVTSVNNGEAGFYLNDADGAAVSNLLIINNTSGFAADYVVNGYARNVFVTDNGIGVQLNQSSEVTFTGHLTMGNNDFTCLTSGSTGLANDTCANTGSSDATLTEDTSAGTCVAGKASDDGVNGESSALVDYGAIEDWTHFAFPHRGWGKSGGVAFPVDGQAGRCDAGLCRIWDMSLVSTDTLCRTINGLPTGANVLLHDGKTALLDAVEIVGDGVGDEDLLCVSGEACIHSPNAGAYQGHGELVSAGAFTDGAITGVTLMRYADNGVP